MNEPTGQEPTKPNNDTPNTPTTPQEPEPKTFGEDYVRELRNEAANYRKELRATQKRLSEIEQANAAAEKEKLEQQGEWQKLAEQNATKAAELEAQLQTQRQRLAAERRNNLAIAVATSLGITDPTDANVTAAVASIDPEADDAEASIRQALEALKENRPYLFGKRQGNLTPFNPSGQEQPGPRRETDAERRARLFGGQTAFFDAENAAAHGGGVIWPKGKPD